MLLAELAATSRDVSATSGRLEKIARLADTLCRLAPEERAVGAAWLSGDLARGRIGIGYAAVRDALGATSAAAAPSLTVAEVDAALARIASAKGAGSGLERRRVLEDLLARATEDERRFLSGLVLGEVRQGALEGVLVEAVARAAGLPAAAVRRAAMLAGALPPVADAALTEGAAGLDRFALRVGEPVGPMLAQTAAGVAEALAALGGEAALEWKLDGARVQVHKDGDRVKVFSRSLRDVTDALPEVVALARASPAARLVLDGEAIALRADGTPEPFQVTMRRFGRKLDVERLAPELPLTAFFFDALVVEDELLARPERDRWAALASAVPADRLVPRLVTADRAAGEVFLEDALRRGQEGVVAKALDAPYEAGRRGAAWLKVKRAHTLDLVVLAAEWGSGRRRGWLSNLHLGARDPASAGGFAMLGKTFKGMTDAMLAWQTERLRGLATGPLEAEGEPPGVRVRPELVVEVAFDGIQASQRYASGLALRFARVKRYREDKGPADADTVETVRGLYEGKT
jgi:DNA ligase 1